MSFCKEDIIRYKPDVLILVDYPGFNLRIAKFAAEQGIRVFYYISPQVWAWKKSRVYKIRKYVERMYVILPFEKDFYAGYDYEVDFVGHPLLDAIRPDASAITDKSDLGLGEKPVIAVIPGSRKQEIATMLSLMGRMTKYFSGHQFVIAGAPSVPDEIYRKATDKYGLKLIKGRMHELLQVSDAAMVTSGTATLETALFRIPEVVCYKGGWLSYQIARRLVKDIKYISLVNLIMDSPVVKELIQGDFNEENLKAELDRLINDKEYRSNMLSNLDALHEKLGGPGASEKAAQLMYARLRNIE